MRGLLLATVLTLVLLASPAAADTAPSLPEPTGRQPVGSTSLYLKDTSRPDPWVPSVSYRELMVSLFYPALWAHGPKARYMTPAESAALLADSGIPDVPPDLLSRVRTHSVRDAWPAGCAHSLPLVVLSPGYKKPRATLSALAEDLASHGYVVAVVDHTYETLATSFPDGRVAGCASCDIPHDPGFWQKLEQGRAADVSFVLDELTGPHAKWRGAYLLDPSRVGMAGHSAGGASTLPTMVNESRIRAGIDIDGTSDTPLLAPGLSRPFMFLSHQLTPTLCQPGVNTPWEQDWQQLTGWKRWLEVAGTVHASFTDVGLVADHLGIDIGASTTGERTQAITRAYINAFFDQHLLGKPRPLLDTASPLYPELVFCH
ncbi:alpha/beta hydrolase family protein [Corallococcus aberystwythensis]|uniref:Alpha/beta hydrolase n=1 Tax=Corallococcus aberystwythensis TaxID=2316722 RepID=A0A3A8QGK5_9BACT|nr:alpha/beta hydrolase [Corallococcus aberystwythensis]RKH67098.1 alpha/beta hydrolase [Corallococcus aberystwythensis]